MLSRGPALLLAPLLLLCRGNPGPAAATPPLCSCLSALLVVFVSVFVFNYLCLFHSCPLPRCYLRPFPPCQPSLPGSPRRSAQRCGCSALRAPSLGRTKKSPSSSAVPCRHECRGLREGCPPASAAADLGGKMGKVWACRRSERWRRVVGFPTGRPTPVPP